MNELGLIEDITREMDRVWGEEGQQGTEEEYAWLLDNYGITELDDVRWILILESTADDLPDDLDDEDQEFLADEEKVVAFLKDLLSRYRSSAAIYPGAK